MSGRKCSYASQASRESPATTLGRSPSNKTHDNSQNGNNQDMPLEDINLTHMELLIHLTTTHKEIFNLGDNLNTNPASLSLFLKTGLESPYPLYQLLAFSARHLAFLHPDSSVAYLHQAATLQTRAVSLFNAATSHQIQPLPAG